MPDITLPLLGPTKRSTALALGGGLVLVVGIGYYRSKKASTSSTDTTAGAGQQIDPATGYAYGSPEDAAAQAALAASVGATPYGGGPNYQPSGGTSQAYTTNAQWSQAAEDYLVNSVHSGQNADTIGNALGKYITGQTLTADQVTIVEEAIAFTGYPPVNGPLGYPPSYRTTQPPSGGGGGGGGGGGTSKPGKVTGLHTTHIAATEIGLAWSKVAGATSYHIHLNGRDFVTVSGTSHTISHDLKRGTRYSIGVVAHNSAGSGPMSATIHVTTHH